MRAEHPATAAARLAPLQGRRFDLLVIGGGINGAGIAREAARRGLSVALVEKLDYAAGTTSRSTRLIHGGVRYLEHGELMLVLESLREREALLRRMPHLVRPLPFLIPVFDRSSRSAQLIRAGMLLYDLLSAGKSVPRHRFLDPGELRRLEGHVGAGGLKGAFFYYDAQVNYPERLLPYATPVPGLFSSAMAQIYPEDRGTNYAVRGGNQVAEVVRKYLEAETGSAPRAAG